MPRNNKNNNTKPPLTEKKKTNINTKKYAELKIANLFFMYQYPGQFNDSG